MYFNMKLVFEEKDIFDFIKNAIVLAMLLYAMKTGDYVVMMLAFTTQLFRYTS